MIKTIRIFFSVAMQLCRSVQSFLAYGFKKEKTTNQNDKM